ncbi:hypothetical protein F2Q69_00000429 [Brassica cretica]|uniref:Calmodulin-binding domain-containing protein n=1 Tax=Brassica cretica TaxID=69181 RepID=A0A8S9NUX3_BRACR|nr:hypothetical protein F2Q69_00000429 [Brassica cretica]
MATSSGTTKTKPDNPNLTRSRSLGRKPKPAPSSEADGSDKKTAEKPVPNYLKPTISSRPDPVKFLKKNSAVEDKLLRRRSFDRPPSSLTSSISSSHNKSLNTSPARSRDRPVVPREKPATGLRSSSFHGSSSRGGLRGSSTVKSTPVASRGSPGVKKSGLSGGSSSKSKKEGSENVPKKPLGKKEIAPESSSPPAPDHKDEEEIVKVETDVQVSELKEEDKDQVTQLEESGEEKETNPVDASKEEVKDEVVQPEDSGEEKETGPVDASKEEEKEELINENATEEQAEEQKEPKNTEEDNNKDKEVVDDHEENIETVVTPDMKEAENAEESKEEESESSKVEEAPTTETKDQAEESTEEGTKKEVVQGKKESPSAYNDVIASKMQENKRKNKVLALAGAFQTVIDYETAASK